MVRLASGETGIVVRRGPTVTTPVVAVLTSAGDQPVPAPVRRDTAHAHYAITGIVDARPAGGVRPETLVALAA